MKLQKPARNRAGEVRPTSPREVERYRRAKLWRFFPKQYVFNALGDLGGKTVCDLGCGEGVIVSQMALLGANVLGMDISRESVEIAKRRALLDGVNDRVEFAVADAEGYGFPENNFDFFVVYEVLHHIEDLDVVMKKIMSGLKPGGKAIIVEPIMYSRMLQRLRGVVPVEPDGDCDDRQLTREEIRKISGYFDDHEIRYFRFTGRLERLFPRGTRMHQRASLFLNVLDYLLLRVLPPLKRFYGITLIVGKKNDGI